MDVRPAGCRERCAGDVRCKELYCIVLYCVARGIYTPVYVDTDSQLADILTKGMRQHQHKAMLPRLLYLPDKSA